MKQFVIPNRQLVAQTTSRSGIPKYNLKDVLGYMQRLETAQKPTDRRIVLDRLHVSWANGTLTARIIEPGGQPSPEYVFTSTGASQMSQWILPGHEFGNLRELAKIKDGDKLATLVWAKWASIQTKPRLVRLIKTMAEGEAVDAIRSCHSANYATYSNVEFIKALLEYGGQLATSPVISWEVYDSSMRIRFQGRPVDPLNPKMPIPMIEAWNSEVGLRKVVLRSGLWKPDSAGAFGHWDENTNYEWRHTGNPDRIRDGVKMAFENLLLAAEDVLGAYKRSIDISIDNAIAWMEKELSERVSLRALDASKKAFTDPTVTPGGKLASVIEAVTIAAAAEKDIDEQYAIELEASRMLKRGINLAGSNNSFSV